MICSAGPSPGGIVSRSSTDLGIGQVVDQILVAPDDQILMITSGNQVIRLKVGDIRKTGRDAKGVRLQRLGEGDEVIAITNLGKQAKQITEITGEPQQTEL